MVQSCSDFGITEGQTYCDTNNNLFKCVNGSLVYQSSNCGGVISTPDPPVAGMIATPSEGTAPLVVTFKETTTGIVAAWQWDFGDGHYDSAGGTKTHTYTSPGIYTVIYTVGNITGQSSVQKRITVTTIQPPVSKICVIGGQYGDIEFTDTYCDPLHNDLYKCTDGVASRVSSCTGQVGDKPDADFYAMPSTGAVGDTIVFVPNVGGGTPTSWDWDFGDGSSHATGSGAKSHTYTKTGFYPVTLVVSNSAGSSIRVGNMLIYAKPPAEDPPVANVIANPSEGTAPLVVTFTDKTTGSTTAWFWSFGDSDTASTGGTKTHIYSNPGTYTATYTVGNSAGNSTWKKVITVTKGVVTPIPKTCSPACAVGYICNTATGVCDKSGGDGTCPTACTAGYSCNTVTKTCVKTTIDGGAVPCVGLNRGGSLDPTCIMEKGNEMYLYGAIGLILLLVVLKSR